MTRARLLLVGAFLIVGLGLLVASLPETPFRGGKLPWDTPTATPGAPGGQARFGEPTAILDVLLAVMILLFGVYVLVHITSPEGRRRILRQAVRLAVILVALFLARDLLAPRGVEEPEREAGPSAVLPWSGLDGAGGRREPSAPPTVPSWAGYLGAALLAGVIALWGWRRWGLRQPHSADQISEVLAEASAELSAGLPVADVVIRCWAQMVAIASRRAKEATAPPLTPRELAEKLVTLGFREEAVRALTRLFEEVRYGHKDSEPRRAEALAALAAIQQAHG